MTSNSLGLRPLEDRIILQRLESEDRTRGGIIIPESAKEKPSKGKVLAVGPGLRSEKDGSLLPMSVKVGDVVMFGKWSGTETDCNDMKIVVMKQSDVLAIYES